MKIKKSLKFSILLLLLIIPGGVIISQSYFTLSNSLYNNYVESPIFKSPQILFLGFEVNNKRRASKFEIGYLKYDDSSFYDDNRLLTIRYFSEVFRRDIIRNLKLYGSVGFNFIEREGVASFRNNRRFEFISQFQVGEELSYSIDLSDSWEISFGAPVSIGLFEYKSITEFGRAFNEFDKHLSLILISILNILLELD